MTAVFIAGSGTDVGKTYVAAGLARACRVRGGRVRVLKPLASGLPPVGDPAFAGSDPAVLLAAAGEPLTPQALEACTPWRFAAPLSPDMAAAAEGRSVDVNDMTAWTRRRIAEPGVDLVVVEGVGGVMSPLSDTATGLDLAAALGLPAVLVCGSYLGAISHGLTALAALRDRGVALACVVVNESLAASVPIEPTVAAFRRFSGGAAVHPLRRGALPDLTWL